MLGTLLELFGIPLLRIGDRDRRLEKGGKDRAVLITVDRT
ncbi:hypothetical protein ACVWW4_000338 [Bradyrhizobium sp. LB7.1]